VATRSRAAAIAVACLVTGAAGTIAPHAAGAAPARATATTVAAATTATAAASAKRPFPDFNRDGKADAVVEIDNADIGAVTNAGAIDVVYGTPFGATVNDWFISQATAGVPGDPTTEGRFGDGTAAGDFNRDGYDDLAVGAWGDTVNGKTQAGALFVFYGSASGLRTTGVQEFDQESPGVYSNAGNDDEFAHAVAAGDVNGDGYADIAVGAPRDNIGTVNNAGIVTLLFGSANGVTSANSQSFWQGGGGLPETPERDDTFGAAVAIGDLNGDGKGDLVVGVPSEDIGNPPKVDAGMVHILYGAAIGSVGTKFTTITGDTGHMPEGAIAGDRFGCWQNIGDFNGDGRLDLEIGADGRTVSGVPLAGAVYILLQTRNGITTAGSQLWSQASAGVPDVPETNDNFGDSTAVGDFNHDGKDDLAVSDDREDLDGVAGINQGAVYVFYGGAKGLTTAGLKFFTQASAGIADAPEDGDQFGSFVQAGDYDGNGYADLYIAAGGETIGSATHAGVVHLLKGVKKANGLTGAGSKLLVQGSGGVDGTPASETWFGGT
jgi:hypothetical protein